MAAHSITIMGEMLEICGHLMVPYPVHLQEDVERLQRCLDAPGMGFVDFPTWCDMDSLNSRLEPHGDIEFPGENEYYERIDILVDLIGRLGRALETEREKWMRAGCPEKLEDWK